jgi:hypothetical protein
MLRPGHDHGAARPSQRLVRGRRDDVGVRDRRRVRPAGDEACDVGDVRRQDRPDLSGDLSERLEVDGPRDGRAAGPDELRALPAGQVPDLVEVDASRLPADAVPDGPEPLAGDRDAPAVCEVAAVRQLHPHHRVARAQERRVDGEIAGGPRVRLDVGVVYPEQGLGPLDGNGLDRIDELLALVVPPAGVPLRVLVREHRPCGSEDRMGDVVLRRDEPDRVAFPPLLAGNERGDLRVGLLEVGAGCALHRAAQLRGRPLRRQLVGPAVAPHAPGAGHPPGARKRLDAYLPVTAWAWAHTREETGLGTRARLDPSPGRLCSADTPGTQLGLPISAPAGPSSNPAPKAPAGRGCGAACVPLRECAEQCQRARPPGARPARQELPRRDNLP